MNTLKKLTALMLAFFMLVCMIACDGGKDSAPKETGSAETNAPIEETTDTPTEAPVDTPTEAPTEVPTEAPTEAPTEPETQAPDPVPLTHVSFDEMTKAGLDITDYLTRPSQTKSAATQDGDTTVLSLTASKAANAGSSDPYPF